VRRRLAATLAAIPEIQISADTSAVHKALAEVRADLAALHDQHIGVDIDEKVVAAQLQRLRQRLRQIEADSISTSAFTDAHTARAQLDALDNLFEQARWRGFDGGGAAAGAFTTAFRQRLDAAVKAIPDIQIGADSTDAQRELAHLRAELATLRDAHIGVDIDEADALAKLAVLQAWLHELSANGATAQIRFDADRARQEVAKLFGDVQTEAQRVADAAAKAAADAALKAADQEAKAAAAALQRAAEQAAKDAADAFGQTFAGKVQHSIGDALRGLPDIQIRADTSEGELAIAAIGSQLAELHDQHIGVDVDETFALARLRYLQTQLEELSRADPSVQVRVDAAAAAAKLAAVAEMVDHVDGRNPRVGVDTDDAVNGLQRLTEATSVSLSRLQYLVTAAVSLGTMLVPAAAVGVAALGALGTAAAAAGTGLGVTILGFSGISTAVKALDAAQKDSAKSAASLSTTQDRVAGALDQVRGAEEALANTRASKAQAARSAARQVQDAELALARAQVQARQAQLALTEARQAEQRAQEDLALQIEDTALAQRQANLDLAKAKEDRDKVLANPRATDAEREQAQITYQQAQQHFKELGVSQQRLVADQQAAAQAGVDGSQRVTAAQDRVRDATDAVADAQRRLADAVQAQSDQQRQASYALAQAQRAVVAAQRSIEQATTRAGVAGGSAMQTLQQAMANLSPTAQRFARFIFGLKDELFTLRSAASDGLLAGAQTAIEQFLPYLPQAAVLVGKVSDALGGMLLQTAHSLSDPTWRRFFGYLADTAVPTLQGLFTAGNNLARGGAALYLALTPLNGDFGGGLLHLTQQFADWATSLQHNNGFQQFLAYAKENLPLVANLLKQMAVFAVRLVIAAAPIGTLLVNAFGKLFELLNAIPTDVLSILIAAIAGVAAAFGVLAAATAIIATGWAGLIIATIAAFAAEFAIFYTKIEPVRAAVDATFHGIADAAVWLWQTILQPAFTAIAWLATGVVAPAFVWLYEHVINPIWQLITVSTNVALAVLQVAFGTFQILIKILGAVFETLYVLFVKPTWDKIKPVLSLLGTFLQLYVVTAFKAGVAAIGKAWDALMDLVKVPVRFVVATVLNDGLLAGYNKIAKIFHVRPDDVHIDLPKGFAVGGQITGAGTATSDSVLIRASTGEHMWTAAEVAAAGGHRAVYGLRQAVLAGTLPAFAGGGPVGDGIGDTLGGLVKAAGRKAGDVIDAAVDFFRDPAGTLRKLADKLIGLVPGADSTFGQALLAVPRNITNTLIGQVTSLLRGNDEGGNSSTGGIGSASMIGILRSVFAGLDMYSGYRPGAITATGNRSYHGMIAANGQPGRAVDVPPRWDVFNWIRAHYPDSRELIFSPAGRLQIWNGKPHLYTGVTKQMHYNHVHWAYDNGGYLPPGMSTVVNNTGRPEPVLNHAQWRQIATLARTGGQQRVNNYHFAFRDTTLTAAKLRAIQDRQDALDRVNRPR
jgi:hypothetical protein